MEDKKGKVVVGEVKSPCYLFRGKLDRTVLVREMDGSIQQDSYYVYDDNDSSGNGKFRRKGYV